MSYNPYAQPAPQQMNIRYPVDGFIIAPQRYEPGRPPVMPNLQYVPPSLGNFYPLLVSIAIDTIQAKAQDNSLRTYLYNQMSENHWNNNAFVAFVDGLAKLVDMRLTKREYTDIPAGITHAAAIYTEMQAAANVRNDPGLYQLLPPEIKNAVQTVLNALANLNEEMQAFFRMMQSNSMLPPPGYQQQQQPQQFAPPPGFQPQPQFANQPPQQPWVHSVAPAYGQGASSASPWRSHQPQMTTAVSAVAPTVPLFRNSAEPAPEVINSDRYADRFSNFTAPATFPRPEQTEVLSVNAQNIQEQRRQKEAQMMNNVPAPAPQSPAAAPVLVKASERDFVPSEVMFMNIAYNPNTTDLYYQVTPEGYTLPKIVQKKESEMEMNKHLVVPSYVTSPPLGTDALDSKVREFETSRVLVDDAIALKDVKPTSLNVAYKDKEFGSSVCLSELWFNNDIELAVMNKREGKANLYRSCGVLLDPIITVKNPKPFIDALANAESFSQACAILKTAHNALNLGDHEHLEPKMLTFLNKRLTERINEFLKKQLAVTNGWMTSFMDDAPELIEFIERKYGEAMRKAVSINQKVLIKQALLYGDEEFEKDQNKFYLQNVKKAPGEDVKLNFTYFFTYCTMTSVDLFSIELNVEIPKTEVAVGILQQQTPLLRHIADNVFIHQKALNIEFGKHLLQTADNIIMELTQSPLGNDIYLVTVI